MSEAYGPSWVRVTLMIYPSTMEIHAIDGDRKEGPGDQEYIGLQLIQSSLEDSQKEVERYRKAFRHTHSSVGKEKGDDSCAECGLDLRDPIHFRLGEQR